MEREVRSGTLEKAITEEKQEKIKRLRETIDTTAHNIEVSKEIIGSTPYDVQQKKLVEKNKKRNHAISGLEKEIRDIEETIE